MNFTSLLYLFIISCSVIAGSIVRYFMQSLFNVSLYKPYGTLIVNMLGCFILGIVSEAFVSHSQSAWYQVISVGFCGSLTTFSSTMLEFYFMLCAGAYVNAFRYIVISFLLGIVSVWIGRCLGVLVLRG